MSQKGKEVPILNIVEPEYIFWKDGVDLLEIPVEFNVDYVINNDEWPEWLKLLKLEPNKILIRVEPLGTFEYAKRKIIKERTCYIKIFSQDETIRDEVLIRQYYKKQPKEDDED